MMRTRTLLLLLLGVLAIAVVGGCTPKPDLAAVKQSGFGTDPVAYCKLGPDKDLIITVINLGGETAPATNTTITFTSLPTGDVTFDRPTPELPTGVSLDLEPIDLSALPSNCYQTDCYFTITLDSTNQVDEANEGNNTIEAYCRG